MTFHTRRGWPRRWRELARTILLGIAFLSTAAEMQGHEGHAPLPTKGAQVDLEKGSLILSREARDALNVKTAEVTLEQVDESVLAYAMLVAPWQRHAFATAKIPGRVVKVHVKPGQHVLTGQLLAELESVELGDLRLEARNAAIEVQLSARILKGMDSLGQNGAIRERDVREARTKHQENVNALEIAQRKWLSLGLSNDDFEKLSTDSRADTAQTLPIFSPIDGVVIHAELSSGQLVAPTEHLFEVVDLSSVWVKVGTLEKDLHRVKVGQPIELSLAAFPGEVFPANVQIVVPYLDPQTHVAAVWAELPNPADQEPRFLPGMHGRARIVVSEPGKSVAIPSAALLNDGVDRFVLVEDEATAHGSQYRKRNVVIGNQGFGKVAIRDGAVFPGDRVVTTGSHELATLFFQGVLRLSPESAKNFGIRIEPVRSRIVEQVVEVDAAVDVPPERRALASSPITGVLENIRIERGQTVHAGDVLAEVASFEFQNLQLEMYRTHLQVSLLENTLENLRDLAQSKVVAQRQLWETESLYNSLVNRREASQKKLETMGVSREQIDAILAKKQFLAALPLRSPIDGVVVHFDKALGQVVKEGDAVFEIHDLSRVWIHGYVPERDLANVQIGQTARVRVVALPSFLEEGKVVRSSRIVGSENRSLSIWVELNAQPKTILPHNMLAQLSLSVQRPAATLAVPHQAIVHEGSRTYVFIRRPDGLFDRRAIQTGRADDRYQEITAGLQDGEDVVIHGAAALQTAYASLR